MITITKFNNKENSTYSIEQLIMRQITIIYKNFSEIIIEKKWIEYE